MSPEEFKSVVESITFILEGRTNYDTILILGCIIAQCVETNEELLLYMALIEKTAALYLKDYNERKLNND